MSVENEKFLGAAEMVNYYRDVLCDYGGQKDQAERFRAADNMIEDINERLNDGVLATHIHRTLVFKCIENSNATDASYEPFCTAQIAAGFRFLGNQLLRVQVHMMSGDALKIRTDGQYGEELILADTNAGVGVNIRHGLQVVSSAEILKYGHYTRDHQDFLSQVARTEFGGKFHWDNSPI
ncbi:MAG TPA: hypothetical protein VF733_06760 [Candidatus Saccharimonadales bacterium]